jgi:phosphatidylglycerophosphate synthase
MVSLVNYYKLYNNAKYFSLSLLLYWTLDNLDGVHARATNQTSQLGEILDHCLDGYILPLFLNMELQYFNIDHMQSKTILVLAISIFSVKHLMNKYTGELSLGFKYFSISELCIIGSLLPFIKLFNISQDLISIIVYLLIILWSIVLFNDIKKLYQEHKIKYYDTILYLCISTLPLYIDNINIIGGAMTLYLLYIKTTQKR